MFSNKVLKIMLILNILDEAGSTLLAEEINEKLDIPLNELNSIGKLMNNTGIIRYDKQLGTFSLIKNLWEISFLDIAAVDSSKTGSGAIRLQEQNDKEPGSNYIDLVSFFYAFNTRNKSVCN